MDVLLATATPSSSSSDDDNENVSNVPTTQSSSSFSASNTGRRRIKTSEIWKHFTEYDTKWKCNKCNANYSKKSGNSTLAKHLKSMHGIGELSSNMMQTTIDLTTGKTSASKPLTDGRKIELTNSLVSWFVDSMTSFSSVENERFIKMLKTFEPKYDPPSRVTISSRVQEQLEVLQPQVKEFINNMPSKISMTTDAWSSCILKGYMGITLHWIDDYWELKSLLLCFKFFPAPHTGDAVCDLMYDVFEDWNISKKILAITSDNGSNIIKGLKALGHKINTEHGYGTVRNDFIIRCLAHTIQLGVKKKALKFWTVS